MSIPVGRISEEAFQVELTALGHGPTQGQLEDWRFHGVIPRPKQVPNLSGSTVHHHPGEARQSLAVSRALTKKKRIQYAGEVMWAAGYEVAPRYWRTQLSKSDHLFRQVARGMNRALRATTEDKTPGKRIDDLGPLTGILHKAARRLDQKELLVAGGLFGDVIAGDFLRFDHEANGREISDRTVASRALGYEAGQNDHIFGHRLTPNRALEGRLSDISKTHAGHNWLELSDLEISAARTDILNGLKFAVCMHDALSWIYGKQAFGLQATAALGRTASTISVFGLTLGFARLRRISAALPSSAEIARLAHQAEMAWLISSYFRDLKNIQPEMRKLIRADRFKRGFVDSVAHKKLLKELAGYEFPQPVFRPWDQWNKLAKKTMAPGLLAMSIGAPSTLDFASVVQGANGQTSL